MQTMSFDLIGYLDSGSIDALERVLSSSEEAGCFQDLQGIADSVYKVVRVDWWYEWGWLHRKGSMYFVMCSVKHRKIAVVVVVVVRHHHSEMDHD